MSVFVNINGVWREAWTNSVNVDGVWRDATFNPKIGDVYRESGAYTITESDIVGFRVIYKRNVNKKFDKLPNLKFNEHLPVNMQITGPGQPAMDMNFKGVSFQYSNFMEPFEEGIYEYDIYMYAVLINDLIVDVCQAPDSEQRYESIIPGITEVWYTNKVANLKIELQAILKYECNGYMFCGWNNLFSTTNCVCAHEFPLKAYRGQLPINSYVILPVDKRDETFRSIGEIGIARDMHDELLNMVGSYGNVDQTVDWITVDGVRKPFSIEVYN